MNSIVIYVIVNKVKKWVPYKISTSRNDTICEIEFQTC
jgi:hypothetical protein